MLGTMIADANNTYVLIQSQDVLKQDSNMHPQQDPSSASSKPSLLSCWKAEEKRDLHSRKAGPEDSQQPREIITTSSALAVELTSGRGGL